MRQLFFYGGRSGNFAETCKPFVESAGGRRARIALLFSNGADGWERNLAWYRDPWLRLGIEEVTPIHPIEATSVLPDEALEALRQSTGIFMCGGDTRQYHRVYAHGLAKEIIGRAYAAGIPYGGLSAGALITPDICSIWGDRLTTDSNRLCLRGSEDGCDEELVVGPGMGLLKGLMIEAHFSERGGFPRLVAAMEQTGISMGLAFDNPTLVHITNEDILRVAGYGRAYILRRTEKQLVQMRLLEPGDQLSLAGLKALAAASVADKVVC